MIVELISSLGNLEAAELKGQMVIINERSLLSDPAENLLKGVVDDVSGSVVCHAPCSVLLKKLTNNADNIETTDNIM